MLLSSDLRPSRAESMSESCLQLKPSNKCLAKMRNTGRRTHSYANVLGLGAA